MNRLIFPMVLVSTVGAIAGAALIKSQDSTPCTIAGQAPIVKAGGVQDTLFMIYCDGQEYEAHRVSPDRVLHADGSTYTSTEEP